MHEHAPQSPHEKHEEEKRPRPVFDLGQMTPDQIAGLIAALGLAYDAHSAASDAGKGEPERWSNEDLLAPLHQELENLASEAPDKAMETYATLMNHPSVWPREFAAYCLSVALLQRHLHDPEARQRILDPWLGMLDHQAGTVREAATQTLDEVYFSDWIDEPMARYLDSRMPAESVAEKRARDYIEED